MVEQLAYWSSILQPLVSLILLGTAGLLFNRMRMIYRERQFYLEKKHETELNILKRQLELKNDEINKKQQLWNTHLELLNEQLKLLTLQRDTGNIPNRKCSLESTELLPKQKHIKKNTRKVITKKY